MTRSPLWSIAAPDTEAPERNNGNMRTWEDIDREREDRFRTTRPELYGWLSDLEEKEEKIHAVSDKERVIPCPTHNGKKAKHVKPG